MIQLAHDLDLIDQTLLALWLAEKVLFGKRFNGKALFGAFFLDQIYPSKGALADHLNGVELLMEVALQEGFTEIGAPLKELGLTFCPQIGVEHVLHKADAIVNLRGVGALLIDVVGAHPLGGHH